MEDTASFQWRFRSRALNYLFATSPLQRHDLELCIFLLKLIFLNRVEKTKILQLVQRCSQRSCNPLSCTISSANCDRIVKINKSG